MRTLIYDAGCGFRTTSALRLADRGTFDPQSWQGIEDLEEFGLSHEKVSTAAHSVVDGRTVASGSDAIAQALILRDGVANALGTVAAGTPSEAPLPCAGCLTR